MPPRLDQTLSNLGSAFASWLEFATTSDRAETRRYQYSDLIGTNLAFAQFHPADQLPFAAILPLSVSNLETFQLAPPFSGYPGGSPGLGGDTWYGDTSLDGADW